LVSRGLLGFIALACLYPSLARLPLADATTIQQTTPLLTALFAWRLLGERIGRGTAFAIASGLAGVVLIVHPTGNGSDPTGIALVLAYAACSSLAFVTVRQLSRTEHPLVIVFYFPLVAAPLALPIDWLLLVAVGATTQAGQVLLTMGLSLERAGRATAVSHLQVLFAMIWQLIAFGAGRRSRVRR
jgi:drug/metabolite transporter (DMT)-like permease